MCIYDLETKKWKKKCSLLRLCSSEFVLPMNNSLLSSEKQKFWFEFIDENSNGRRIKGKDKSKLIEYC